jgi:hypothetical protein
MLFKKVFAKNSSWSNITRREKLDWFNNIILCLFATSSVRFLAAGGPLPFGRADEIQISFTILVVMSAFVTIVNVFSKNYAHVFAALLIPSLAFGTYYSVSAFSLGLGMFVRMIAMNSLIVSAPLAIGIVVLVLYDFALKYGRTKSGEA